MKKIMKKALSVMLALVLVFALAPVTSNAAVGDGVAMPSTCIYSGESVTVQAGATTYFEIGTMGTLGTFDFIVEGTGAFDVAVCTEGTGDTPYAEGESVSAVDGKVETEITIYESTSCYGAFSITNNTDAEGTYYVTIVLPEGTSSNPKTLTLALDTPQTVTVPAGGSTYYVLATLPQQQVEYNLTITGNTGFGYSNGMGMPVYDTNGTIATTIGQYRPNGAQIQLVNNTQEDIVCSIVISEIVKEVGVEGNAEPITPSTTLLEKALAENEYWYTWTATEAGTFTLTMNNSLCADGWTYKLYHGDVTKNFSTGWDESDKNVCAVVVAAGDTVEFGLSIPTYYGESIGYDVYTFASGTVYFTVTFEAGTSTPDPNPNPNPNPEPEPNPSTGFENIDSEVAEKSQTNLSVGTSEYTVSNAYPYTVFALEPTETGKYTISSTDSVLGIVSNNGMWITIEPSAETVKDNSLVWECDSVGQSIWVAVLSDTNVANITVAREALQEKEETKVTIYKNKVTPKPYVFYGDVDELYYVDFESEDVSNDMVVLSADGYYHWGSASGPIVLVDLNDEQMNLHNAAYENGQLSVYLFGDNDEVVEKVDYNEALLEYFECADETTALYPLTIDLMTILQEVGDFREWYGEEGWLKVPVETGWMFALYFEMSMVSVVPEGEDAIVSKDDMADFIEAAKTESLPVIFNVLVGDDAILSFEFVSDKMAVSDDVTEYNFNVSIIDDYTEATKNKEQINKDKFVLRVNFAHTGKLPGEATITIPVGTEYTDKVLYYYQVLEDGSLEYTGQSAKVDKAGNFIVKQDHCSDYVVSLEAPEIVNTGDTGMTALYVAILLFGCAAVVVGLVAKKKFA